MVNTEKYKKLLLEEKEKLETELGNIAEKDPEAVGGWQATGAPEDKEHADRNEVADHLEELGDREALESTFEERLSSINNALLRIEAGEFGMCEVGGVKHEIEEARLDANPAAKTCIEHLDQEL